MRELFETLGQLARTSSNRPAFDDGRCRLTYAELAGRVAAVADDLRSLRSDPSTVAVLAGHRVDDVVAQVAGWHATKTVVPLPAFFSPMQQRHVLADAGVEHGLVSREMAAVADGLGLSFTVISDRQSPYVSPPEAGAGQIVYTSGSTGQPKGVLLRGTQLLWTARALADAVGARSEDVYLSVMPLPLLLETICAVVIPILTGASVKLDPANLAVFGESGGRAIAKAVATHRPSCMVLVPQLLARWIWELQETGTRAPDSLRFVAVGGAPVPANLAEQGWNLGIPVHEGYGLSECCSVVALNRPGHRCRGTVGRPLPGLDVCCEDGEIVVRGPSVMERYRNGAPTRGVWRTGDAGEVAADGTLTVHGRLDNVIVTPLGRNVSPEWIEAAIAMDGRIAECAVTHVDGPHLTAILVPRTRDEDWFARASSFELVSLVAECCRELPAYAVPRDAITVTKTELESRIQPSAGFGNRRTGLLGAIPAILAARASAALEPHEVIT